VTVTAIELSLRAADTYRRTYDVPSTLPVPIGAIPLLTSPVDPGHFYSRGVLTIMCLLRSPTAKISYGTRDRFVGEFAWG